MKKIFLIARALFPVFLEAHKDELGDKKGIVLVVNEISNSQSGNDALLGEIPEEKIAEKRGFGYEKVERLRERNSQGFAELTSFASENVEKKQFGGGIKTKNYYLGASNLPPHLDQKFLLTLALLVNELSYTDALKIMEESFLQRKAWEQNPEK